MARQVSRFSSLRFKFALALVLFSSLLMIAVMLTLEQRLRETLIQENINKGLGIAQGLAFNAEDPLLTGDDLYLFSAVKNAMHSPGVLYALILDRNQVIRADTVFDRIGKAFHPHENSTPLKSSDNFSLSKVVTGDGITHFNLEVPIITLGDKPIRIGQIHLGLSEELINRSIQEMRILLLGLTVLALVIGGVGAAVLAGMLVGPLSVLVRGVKGIGEGNFDQHITLKRKDEIGVLTDAFNDMATQLRDKDFIRSTFERYVSKPLAEQLLETKDEQQLGGEVRDVTILFSDIRRFTTLAEKLPPEQVVNILNEYFSRMIDVVNRHEGMVDKLMGDSVMALFGAPVTRGGEPLRAIRCALEMQQAGQLFNQNQKEKGHPVLPMGIGINTGAVVAGNIGSSTKMEYTVIGDEVNIAARMQGIAQPGEVLISEKTYQHVKDVVQVTALDTITFKGKNTVVAVYRVDGLVENE